MTTTITTVLHLVGSPTSDFYAEVSRLYAADCLQATAAERYDFHVAYVTPDGRWRFPADLSAGAIEVAEPVDLPAAVVRITAIAPDVMVPQMFCVAGMTHYRALFDLLGVPYLGNTPDVMAVGADKARACAVVAARGVRVPDSQVVRPGEDVSLDLPVVVKPVDADNSLGVTLVREAADLPIAVETACGHAVGARRALVEAYVELGREVRCGVVDLGGELVALPLEEYAVDAGTKPIRDQADKLRRAEDGELGLVAKDAEHAWIVAADDPVVARVQQAALRCYDALGCRHYGLFDFRVDPDGEPYFLEAGLYCSYARTSVVAVMAGAAGIALDRLFALAVDHALRSGHPADPDAPAGSTPTSPRIEERPCRPRSSTPSVSG